MLGWFAVHRKLWRHEFFKDSPMSEREAWLWMVSRAAYEDTTQDVSGVAIKVPRGSFLTTLRQLQSRFMWGSEKRVRTFLKRLENGRMIGRSLDGPKGAKKTQITICNYRQFQDIGRSSDSAGGRSLDAGRDAQKKQGLTNNNTLPYGSDGRTVDFQKAIFDNGVAYLCQHNVDPKQARSLVGKWRKAHDAETVFKAFAAANREGVTDPVGWITKFLQPASATDLNDMFQKAQETIQ